VALTLGDVDQHWIHSWRVTHETYKRLIVGRVYHNKKSNIIIIMKLFHIHSISLKKLRECKDYCVKHIV